MLFKEETLEQVGKRPACFNGPLLPGGEANGRENLPMQEYNTSENIQFPPLVNFDEDDSSTRVPFPLPNYDEVVSVDRKLPLALPAPEPHSYQSNDKISNYDENEHRYVGLVNQAMTCYLNSLIQTLYMTPEFRNAIYTWKFSGKLTEESKNIPYQLQKLFLLLQTSDKSSLETKDLTASFGWESNDAYDQHDVQELCRLMFDALEHRWKKTENRTLIQDLYKGNVEDYVKCLRCFTEKIKHDVFLDLPLAVRQFGAKESFKSIEEALQAFVKPEILDEQNKYFCEQCNTKQIAEKGLRITNFPYILTIQLKRFDFDYTTHCRVKLNDKMTFPDFLDLNDYVYVSSTPQIPKMSYASAASKTPPPTTRKECELNTQSPINESKEQEWLNVQRDSEKVSEMLKKGKYVYELLSIMVHQGNASGGHYFAYIKNLDQDRWFCFNDSSVQSATFAEIHRTFGGSSAGWSNSNTNAYMLMYRQVDSNRNRNFIRTATLPLHLVDLKEKLERDLIEREIQQRFQDEHIKVYYIYNHQDYIECEPRVTNIHKDIPLRSALDMFTDEFEKDGNTIDPDMETRLILCDNLWKMKQWLDDLDSTIESISDNDYFRSEVYFMIDTKPSWITEDFYRLSSGSKTFDVNLVDLEQNSIRRVRRFALDDQLSIAEVKRLMCYIAQVHFDTQNVRLVVDRVFDEDSSLLVLNRDSQLLWQANISYMYGKLQLYVDYASPKVLLLDRAEKNFMATQMYKIIDHKKFCTRIKIYLPTAAEYTRAGLEPRDLENLDEQFETVLPPPPPSHPPPSLNSAVPVINENNAESENCENIKPADVIENKMPIKVDAEAQIAPNIVPGSSNDGSQSLCTSSSASATSFWANNYSYRNASTNVIYSCDNQNPTTSFHNNNSNSNNSAVSKNNNIDSKYNTDASDPFLTLLFRHQQVPGYGVGDTATPPPPYTPNVEDSNNNNFNENASKVRSELFCISEPPSPVSTAHDDDCMDVSDSPCGSTPKRSPIVSENEESNDGDGNYQYFNEQLLNTTYDLMHSLHAQKPQVLDTKRIEELPFPYGKQRRDSDGQTLVGSVDNDNNNNNCSSTSCSKAADGTSMHANKSDSNSSINLHHTTVVNQRTTSVLSNHSSSWNNGGEEDDDNDSGAECGSVGAGGEGSFNNNIYNKNEVRQMPLTTSNTAIKTCYFPDKDEGLPCETILGGESTSESGAATISTTETLPLNSNIFVLKIVEMKNDANKIPYIVAEVDRRLLSIHFKYWISQFLDLDYSDFRILTHYNELDDGFDANFEDTDTVRDNFVTTNHLSVRLNFADDNESKRPLYFAPSSRYNRDSHDGNINSVIPLNSSRRERPLRIQMASFSEND